MVTIQQLAIYPVKSLRGFNVSSAELTPQGLLYRNPNDQSPQSTGLRDRQWMIVDHNNRFISQRKFSQMILIHTRFEGDILEIYKPTAPHLTPLRININHYPNGETFEAVIWKDTCQVIDEGVEASLWLTQALESPTPLRLVRMQEGAKRPQSKPHLVGAETHTHFADAVPFLVANTASLAAVNQQLINADLSPVPMERFRPNIVLDGITAFEEHQCKGFQHANYTFTHCYPCQRCVMPTIDIETGIRHPKQQPFSLLSDINAMPDNAKAPAFGENAILIAGSHNTIHVGDTVEIN